MRTAIMVTAAVLLIGSPAHAMCCGGMAEGDKAKMQCGAMKDKSASSASDRADATPQSKDPHAGMDMGDKSEGGMKMAGGCSCGCCGGKSGS